MSTIINGTTGITTASIAASTNISTVSLSVSGAGVSPPDALTDGATITWDWATAQSATVTLGGNRTLSNPTNAVDGQYCAIRVSRSGTFILSFGTLFKGISSITQSNTAGTVDHFVFRYNGTNFELVSFKANVGA